MTAAALCNELRSKYQLAASDPVEQDPRYKDSNACVLLPRGVFVRITFFQDKKFFHLERFNGQTLQHIAGPALTVLEVVTAYRIYRTSILKDKE